MSYIMSPSGCGNGNCMDTASLEEPTSAFYSLKPDVILEKSATTVSHVTMIPGLRVCSQPPPHHFSVWPRFLGLLNNNSRFRWCHLVWIQGVMGRSIFSLKLPFEPCFLWTPDDSIMLWGLHQLLCTSLTAAVLGLGTGAQMVGLGWAGDQRSTDPRWMSAVQFGMVWVALTGWIYTHADGWECSCSVSRVLSTCDLSPGHHLKWDIVLTTFLHLSFLVSNSCGLLLLLVCLDLVVFFL